MTREQMITHLVLHGWEPYTRLSIMHPEIGNIMANFNNDGGATHASYMSNRSHGYTWDDIGNYHLTVIYARLEKVMAEYES